MAISYFAEDFLDKEFIINNYKVRKIRDSFLVVVDHGSWVLLNDDEYSLLRLGRVKENLSLFNLLKEKGIIITKENVKDIIKQYKERYSFLNKGTSLHIVAVTQRCNQRCLYCYAEAENLENKNHDMDSDTGKAVVDFVFQTPSKDVVIEFQGGEPLLNFETIKVIIEYAKELNKKYKKNLYFDLVSTLTLIDKDIVNYLKENNVGICTSLDGPKEVHDKNRRYLGGNGTYEDVIRGIDLVKENYGKISALMVTTKFSFPYYKEIIDEYVKHGFMKVRLKSMSNIGYAQKVWKEIGYTGDEYLDFWKKSMDYIFKLNREDKFLIEDLSNIIVKKFLNKKDVLFTDLQSPPCGAAISQMAYNYSGDIFTCDEGRLFELFKLGNVKKDKFRDVIKNEQTCGIISSSMTDVQFCDTCVFKPYCGLCPVCNYAEHGSVITKIPLSERCKILKGMFSYLFEKMVYSDDKEILFNWTKYR